MVSMIPLLPFLWARFEVPGLHVLNAMNLVACLTYVLVLGLRSPRRLVRALTFLVFVVAALQSVRTSYSFGRTLLFHAIENDLRAIVADMANTGTDVSWRSEDIPSEYRNTVEAAALYRYDNGEYAAILFTSHAFPVYHRGYIYVSSRKTYSAGRELEFATKVNWLNDNWLDFGT